MLAAPKWANEFYFKEHHKSSHETKNWQSWYVARPIRPAA